MKLEAFELPMAKPLQPRKRKSTIRILIALTLFLTIAPIYYPSLQYSVKKIIQDSNAVERDKSQLATVPKSSNQDAISQTSSTSSTKRDLSVAKEAEKLHHSHGGIEDKCELFSGKWVPNPEAPYYTNMTCWEIQEHQNCMKFGRPDTGFMKWRWKPDGCELPLFDPQQFLELVRGKSLAFVGDSVARNQMQSLICLLSRVVYPVDVSNANEIEIKRWTYPSYNFNITIYWSPFLVKSNTSDLSRLFPIHLDEFDETWTREIHGFDYVIMSAHHWFKRPAIFFENGQIIGCLYCPDASNLTHFPPIFGYQKAYRTAFKAINSVDKFKGIVFLRTFAPQHFENGTWDNGGNCVRQKPFMRNETELKGEALELREIQLKEFKIAEEEGRKRGLKFILFDVTFPMLLRPDGHPSKYGHWPHETRVMPNDCVHWCLPGPIDTWSDFLQELLRREVENRSSIS